MKSSKGYCHKILYASLTLAWLAIMSTSFYAQTAPTKAPPSQKNTDATGEPSLAETLGWIQQKLTTGAGMYSKADKTRIKIDGVRVDDCTITYNEFFDSDGAGGDVDTSFQLKDIDPSSIKVEDFLGGFVVRYNTLDSKQAINRSGRKVDKGFIAFQEQDLAARFARALTHAIKLCAGKREPF